jgi:predicted nucleic acid-binding protein
VIVTDASVVLEVILRTQTGMKIQGRVLSARETLHAPHLIDLEVCQVLRRYLHNRQLTADRAYDAMEDFQSMRIFRYPHQVFWKRIWELRNNMTAYDAAYIAVAETISAPLLTTDKRLASTQNHSAKIEFLGGHG